MRRWVVGMRGQYLLEAARGAGQVAPLRADPAQADPHLGGIGAEFEAFAVAQFRAARVPGGLVRSSELEQRAGLAPQLQRARVARDRVVDLTAA